MEVSEGLDQRDSGEGSERRLQSTYAVKVRQQKLAHRANVEGLEPCLLPKAVAVYGDRPFSDGSTRSLGRDLT